MIELKIRRVGNSSGVVLPKEMMARLRVGEGDTLFVIETPDGYRIEPHDPTVRRQVEAARRQAKKWRGALRELAK